MNARNDVERATEQSIDPQDAFFRAQALQLARRVAKKARAAMVVKRGRVVGRAIQEVGQPELVALEEARSAARGATLYVSHAPSTSLIDVVRKAGIRRVVLAEGVVPPGAPAWAAAGISLEWG